MKKSVLVVCEGQYSWWGTNELTDAGQAEMAKAIDNIKQRKLGSLAIIAPEGGGKLSGEALQAGLPGSELFISKYMAEKQNTVRNDVTLGAYISRTLLETGRPNQDGRDVLVVLDPTQFVSKDNQFLELAMGHIGRPYGEVAEFPEEAVADALMAVQRAAV